MPEGLEPAGPYDGPTLSELVRRRAAIYWLEAGENGAPPWCERWTLDSRPSGAAALVSRVRLATGDTLITRFGFEFDKAASLEGAGVTLLWPSSEVIAPPGQQPQSAGMSFGCGEMYTVVGARGGVMSVIRGEERLARIVGYVPSDAERWYTSSEACERDAARLRTPNVAMAAVGFGLHQGC
jgi:hypothetical protein